MSKALDQHAAALAVGDEPGARLSGRLLARFFFVAPRAAEFPPQLFWRTFRLPRAPGVSG
jgi:hypothetical protein